MPDNSKKILDTFLFQNGNIAYKTEHAERTAEAFQFLKKEVTPELVQDFYNYLELNLREEKTEEALVRVIFEGPEFGHFDLEIKKIDPTPETIYLKPVQITAHPQIEFQFKFTDRDRWIPYLEKKSQNAHDILLINDKNEIIETSRFNVFLYDESQSAYLTPPLSSGCVNGVLRRFSLKRKTAKEEVITLEQAKAGQLFVGNSVRGFKKANLVD